MIRVALAVRDVRLAERLAAAAAPATSPGSTDFAKAMAAVVRRDMDALRSSVERMARAKTPRDEQWKHTCLKGIVDASPEVVAQGLQSRIDRQRNRRGNELDIVDLECHGFYRLCQWASPDLVAAFDTTQPLPWDAGLHAWLDDHEDPLADLDLTSISSHLHQAIVLLQPPAWWSQPDSGA
jgi:hypothetical protein